MVRSIELQEALSKAEVVGKLKQMKKAASEMEQRMATSTLKRKTIADAERAREPEKSDLLIISRENRNRNGKKQNPDDNKEHQNNKPAEDDEDSSGRLDVKA